MSFDCKSLTNSLRVREEDLWSDIDVSDPSVTGRAVVPNVKEKNFNVLNQRRGRGRDETRISQSITISTRQLTAEPKILRFEQENQQINRSSFFEGGVHVCVTTKLQQVQCRPQVQQFQGQATQKGRVEPFVQVHALQTVYAR